MIAYMHIDVANKLHMIIIDNYLYLQIHSNFS